MKLSHTGLHDGVGASDHEGCPSGVHDFHYYRLVRCTFLAEKLVKMVSFGEEGERLR